MPDNNDSIFVDSIKSAPSKLGKQTCTMCSICKKEMNTIQNMKLHIHMKHVRALFNCSFCKNKYISQSKLDTHINKIHKNCNEKFKIKNNKTKSNIFSDDKWK